jgi:hypothetical protein
VDLTNYYTREEVMKMLDEELNLLKEDLTEKMVDTTD